MIKPGIGRVVWFYPPGHQPGDQPLAAIVVHVWGDRCVNLGVFCPNGDPMLKPPTSITLVQPEDEVPAEGCYCTWMPFQIGQAAALAAGATLLPAAPVQEPFPNTFGATEPEKAPDPVAPEPVSEPAPAVEHDPEPRKPGRKRKPKKS